MSTDTTVEQFICPITLEIMTDPVICDDGYTYERNAILNINNSISPMTRQPINLNNLIPNRALRELIEKSINPTNPTNSTNPTNPTDEFNEQMRKILINPNCIRHMTNPSDELWLQAIALNGLVIRYNLNPSEEMKLKALEQNGMSIRYIINPSEEMKLKALGQNELAIRYIRK